MTAGATITIFDAMDTTLPHADVRPSMHRPAGYSQAVGVDRGRRPAVARTLAVTGVTVLATALAAGIASAHDMSDHMADAPVRSIRSYTVPAVDLVRDDGKRVSLPAEMNDGRPVVLNFIFTTCTSICPLMSSVLSQFERRLGDDAAKVHLMSISIDPEQDTPARLLEYARRFHAGREWQHYTGTLDASVAAQRAFDVSRGGKMSHSAVTLIRAAPGTPWLRIEGFVTPDDLVRDYHEQLARR